MAQLIVTPRPGAALDELAVGSSGGAGGSGGAPSSLLPSLTSKIERLIQRTPPVSGAATPSSHQLSLPPVLSSASLSGAAPAQSASAPSLPPVLSSGVLWSTKPSSWLSAPPAGLAQSASAPALPYLNASACWALGAAPLTVEMASNGAFQNCRLPLLRSPLKGGGAIARMEIEEEEDERAAARTRRRRLRGNEDEARTAVENGFVQQRIRPSARGERVVLVGRPLE